MNRLSKRIVSLTALAGFSAAALAAEPSYQELVQRIDQLQTKIDQLEAKQVETVSAQDIDSTVDRVIQDAEQRSQMLQVEGFTAGYSKGKFIIQDASGNWLLNPFLQFQFQGVANFRGDGKHAGDSNDTESGLEVRRMKFGFTGNAMNPKLTYFFRWNSGFNTGAPALEEAWVRYQLNNDWAVRGGQMTNPTFREQTVQSGKKLAVERSLMNELLTGSDQAYTQAITLQYDNKATPLWTEFGIEDGFNSQNTDFTDPNAGGKNDWGAVGRVNWFVQGNRKDFDDFTALETTSTLLVLGAGGDVTQTGDSASYKHVIDVDWKTPQGFGIYAAYVGNYVNNSAGNDLYNWGVLVQGNYLFAQNWEAFARYDFTKFDSDAVLSGEGNEFCEATLGVNWYVSGSHNVRFTFDFTWLPSGAPSTIHGNPIDLTNLGILGSGENEYLFRGQFQLLL